VVRVWCAGVICRPVRGSSGRGDWGIGSGGPGCGAEPGECGGQAGGPGPVFVDLEVPGASGADESGGHVQESVAQRGRFAAGQLAVQAERLGPGARVGGGEGEFEAYLVLLVAAAGQVAQAGRFRAADAVLDAGVGAVPDFQVGVLPVSAAGRGVGDECGDAVSVGVGEPQLCARVWAFAATITREPSGHFDRSSRPVNSATQAPGPRIGTHGRIFRPERLHRPPARPLSLEPHLANGDVNSAEE